MLLQSVRDHLDLLFLFLPYYDYSAGFLDTALFSWRLLERLVGCIEGCEAQILSAGNPQIFFRKENQIPLNFLFGA